MMKGKEIISAQQPNYYFHLPIDHLPNNFTKPDIPAKLTLASFDLGLFGGNSFRFHSHTVWITSLFNSFLEFR